MNYSTYLKLKQVRLQTENTPPVVGADGSDLGAAGTIQCTLQLGTEQVTQSFIVCSQLLRNVIVGVDFEKANCAGMSWTPQGTRVLSVKGKDTIEVAEDELGIPVMTYVTYITIVLVSIKSPSSQLTGAFRLYLSQGATAVVHGCSIRALDPNAE